MQSNSLRFADVGRILSQEARRSGWVAPTFKSPPRTLGRDRTLRRRANGSATVSVRLNGRPFAAVVADMVEGVIATNEFIGDDAERCRRELWIALDGVIGEVLDAA